MGNMTLFRCTEQSPWLRDDPTLGWKPYVMGHIEIVSIPGHHGNLVEEPGIQVLAKELRKCMDKCIDTSKSVNLTFTEEPETRKTTEPISSHKSN